MMILAVLALQVLSLSIPTGVEALPEDYPVRLSGDYLEELPNSTTYIDYLQPDQTENYLIHLENPDPFEVTYRITLSSVPEDWVVFLGDNLDQTLYINMEEFESQATALFLKNLKPGTANININITNENTGKIWPLVLRIICKEGPLKLDLEPGSYILGRDIPVEVPLDVMNVGAELLNVSLEMDGFIPSNVQLPDSWSVSYSERNFLLPPGATKSVIATIWSPEFESVGSQRVTSIKGMVKGVSRPYLSPSFTVRVSTIYDLRTSVVPIGYQKVAPGDSVEFEITLENWAYETDYVIINEFSTPSGYVIGWNDEIDPTSFSISISPESSRSFHAVIYIPNNALAGKHTVLLKAVGEANVTDIELKVQVAREDEMEAVSTPSGGGSTYRMTLGTNSIPFTLINRGNFFDTVTLEIENRPAWTEVFFKRIRIGSGEDKQTVSGGGSINVSGLSSALFDLEEEGLDKIVISMSPSQTITVVLGSEVSMDEGTNDGVIGIKYRYGQLGNQKLLQMPLKLIIVDLEIVDRDQDGIPDINVWPLPEYDVGDKIRFTFDIKNNYPFATREGEVKYTIKLSGALLLDGGIGVIEPGETKRFNVTWKADVSTNLRAQAILALTGDAYPVESQAPSARTDEEIFIRSTEVERPWGLMIGFTIFMIVLILVFLLFWMFSQKSVQERNREEMEKYESIYGSRRKEHGADRRRRLERGAGKRSLSARKRPELPSKKGEDSGKGSKEEKKTPGKRKIPPKKDPKDPKQDKEPDRPKKKKAPKLEEMEELEELEET